MSRKSIWSCRGWWAQSMGVTTPQGPRKNTKKLAECNGGVLQHTQISRKLSQMGLTPWNLWMKSPSKVSTVQYAWVDQITPMQLTYAQHGHLWFMSMISFCINRATDHKYIHCVVRSEFMENFQSFKIICVCLMHIQNLTLYLWALRNADTPNVAKLISRCEDLV